MTFHVSVDALLNFSIEAKTEEEAQKEAMRLAEELLANFDNDAFLNYQAFTKDRLIKYNEYVALFLVIMGVWFIGELNVFGQWCMLGAQVLWFVVGLSRRMWSLAVQSFVLFLMTARAIHLWQLS